jgi:ubiquinone/menaquinone biosynthesis C-methylase UbiE
MTPPTAPTLRRVQHDEHMTSPPGMGSGVMHPHGAHRIGHALWFSPVYAALVRAVHVGPGERVLDVGAGTGALSGRLARAGAAVVCLEPDAQSLEAARRRLAGLDVEFVEASAEHIPLPDASVDAAVASVTAHHWGDQRAGFEELVRVLRPGGRLVLAEFRPAGPVLRQLRRIAGSKHVGAPDAVEWTVRLRDAGFSAVEVPRVGPAAAFALFLRATR